MATIKIESPRLITATRIAINTATAAMEDEMEIYIDKMMLQTKFSFSQFKRVPKHETREQALKQMQIVPSGMFEFSPYFNIRWPYLKEIRNLKHLQEMALAASEVVLTEKDFQLVKHELGEFK